MTSHSRSHLVEFRYGSILVGNIQLSYAIVPSSWSLCESFEMYDFSNYFDENVTKKNISMISIRKIPFSDFCKISLNCENHPEFPQQFCKFYSLFWVGNIFYHVTGNFSIIQEKLFLLKINFLSAWKTFWKVGQCGNLLKLFSEKWPGFIYWLTGTSLKFSNFDNIIHKILNL